MRQHTDRSVGKCSGTRPAKRWSAMSDNLLTVLVVEPAKPPYVKQIPDTLQAMQEIVGGNIDATYPFEDPVALVFNSEGKFSDLQPNRLLRLENGDPYDVVCGTFFLAGLGGETFVSLTQDQLQRYGALYNREMLFPFPKRKREQMSMNDKTILTAESVTAGHPDKLCDISLRIKAPMSTMRTHPKQNVPRMGRRDDILRTGTSETVRRRHGDRQPQVYRPGLFGNAGKGPPCPCSVCNIGSCGSLPSFGTTLGS